MNMCPKCSHHVMSHAYRPVTKQNNGHCLTPACDCQGWNAPQEARNGVSERLTALS